MDAYGCWFTGLTGTNGAFRGDLYRLLRAMEEESPTGEPQNWIRDLYHMDEGALLSLVDRTMLGTNRGPSLFALLVEGRRKEPERIREELGRQGITCISYYEAAFPEMLREVPDPPIGLYYKGRLPEEDRPAVSIIGARMASAYGRMEAREFALELARNGIQIVSGMARGIDGIAGLAALEVSDDSYAVLGCGVDICYPAENKHLYQQLITRGGVISEFPPGTEAVRTNFPQRNRLISGFSQVVLVIEAREKSGSLITVDLAVEQGRDVFALPGRVTDRTSHGCNELIRQGAFPATSPDDILTFLFCETAEHVRMRNRTQEAVPEKMREQVNKRRKETGAREAAAESRLQEQLGRLGEIERAVYGALDAATPVGVDGLLPLVRKRLGRKVSVSEVMRAITILLMAGLARELRVGNYIRVL